MLFYVWKASGADPYKLYNSLGDDYRPLAVPDAEPRPPQFPERVRTFIYACGLRVRELEREDADRQAMLIAKAIGG
jgi:hypothetical protein